MSLTETCPPRPTPAPILSEAELKTKIKRKTYLAILELTSRHPLLTSEDIATMTGASLPWVKSIMKSDSFMAQRAARVEELHGPRLIEIQAKMETTLSLMIDAIAKRIANPDAEVTEDTLLKAFTALADRVIPKKEAAPAVTPLTAAPSVNFNFTGVSPADLDRARQAALEKSSAITVQAIPVKEVSNVDEDGIPKIARIRSNEGID